MTPKADPLMDHFMNPRNVGELPDADGVGDVGNPICGDMVRLFVKIKNDKIEKATFLEDSTNQDLQLRDCCRGHIFALDGSPGAEAFPVGSKRAQAGL